MTLAREARRPVGEFGEQLVDDLPDKEHDKRNWPCSRHPLARLEHDRVASEHRQSIEEQSRGTEDRAAVAAQLPRLSAWGN